VFWRRHYTVMVVPDARANMKRFHLEGKHLALGLSGVAVILALAFAAPLLLAWGVRLDSRLAAVEAERDRLAENSASMEASLADLREKLDRFERRTEKLAALAGLDLPSVQSGGQGVGTGIENLAPRAKADVLAAEAEALHDRSDLVERRLETVERAIHSQSERLAHVPSIFPVRGLIGAGFGWRRDPFTGLRQFHRGIDISAPEGTPVRAPADGIVVKTERNGGYGKVLYISHGNGIVTRYGHLSAYRVRPGQKVRRGDVIALVGNTGRSTAPHLHYEVLVGGKQVDPMRYIMDDGLFY